MLGKEDKAKFYSEYIAAGILAVYDKDVYSRVEHDKKLGHPSISDLAKAHLLPKNKHPRLQPERELRPDEKVVNIWVKV